MSLPLNSFPVAAMEEVTDKFHDGDARCSIFPAAINQPEVRERKVFNAKAQEARSFKKVQSSKSEVCRLEKQNLNSPIKDQGPQSEYILTYSINLAPLSLLRLGVNKLLTLSQLPAFFPFKGLA